MLLYVYLLLALESVFGQKQSVRGGNRYAPVPYYNVSPKPGNGVGVLQDLSNARILSNEPFIISFEFPKLISSGDSRKNRFAGKSSRSKSQRKKNRKPRQFRHILVPEKELLGRRKRLEIMRRSPPFSGIESVTGIPNLVSNDWRTGKGLINPAEASNPSERTDLGHLNLEAKEDNQTTNEVEAKQSVQIINSFQETPKPVVDEELKSIYQQNWENIKDKWMSMFAKQNEGNDNVVDDNEDTLKVMSRKMWANCQLLKLLKAPQRNPYFYKLLPPNYPAIIMDEEKQLQCNQFYDITDLAKDKQMISEKIEQLERILSTGNDSGTRKKREAPEGEDKAEEENTLQDESLQGKLEGEVRSDRSKRTKERQHIRRQRSKDPSKEKTKRVKRPAKKNTKESRREENDRQTEAVESDSVKRARRKDKANELQTKKMIEENDVKQEEDRKEGNKEKQELKTGKDNSLQDVFNPSEVNKVIRQKEMEANIFDKVLRAMRKYEDNNPYDGFRPQKRESGNSTETPVVVKNGTTEEGWELEDTIKKLAKIFKVLGVKAEAAKRKACTDCNETEENSSEESTEVEKSLKNKSGKSPKCTCADCPFCQNCLQCFKECKKAALAAKNSLSDNQTPVTSPLTAATQGFKGEKDLASERNGREMKSIGPQEENVAVGGDRNNMKLERMYRSKLPPSRDLVRVYFDNPENKLLVWTKRGRRTMPWGPLTSDLQLYRDRARQILKSAEDILHRIRETEEKLHAGQYDENEHGASSDKNQKMNTMDDVISTVVNEDETKAILKTPWRDELAKGVIDGKIVHSNHILKNSEEGNIDNIFKVGIPEKTKLAKESLTSEDVKGVFDNEANVDGDSRESYEVGKVEAAEPKVDTQNRMDETMSINEEVESVHRQGNTNGEMDGESVEAAVLPIEKKEELSDLRINFNDSDNEKNVEQVKDAKESAHGWKEQEEEEDIPAKVEAINQDKVTEEPASKIKAKVKADRQLKRKNIVDYINKKLGKGKYGQRTESGESKDDEIGDGEETLKKVISTKMQSLEQDYSAQSQSEEGSGSEEKENVKSHNNHESEKVEMTSKGESEEVERAHIYKSDETDKTYSGNSGEVKASHTGESKKTEMASEEESEEVERASGDESAEVGETYRAKSELTEVARSRESEEVEKASKGESREGRKAYSDESKEVEETYDDESESVERAQHQSSESQDVEKSAEKIIGELKKVIKQGEPTLQSKQDSQVNAEVENNDDSVAKEPERAHEVENKKHLLTDTQKKDSAQVEKSAYEKDESGEEKKSYEDEEQVERKGSNPGRSAEEAEDTQEDVQQGSPHTEMKELEPETEEAVEKEHEETPADGDHSKSIEESYIIQGVKQSKEEKEAILKALLNAKKKNDEIAVAGEETAHETDDEDVAGVKEEDEVEGLVEAMKSGEKEMDVEGDPLTAVVRHLEKGHINENDLEVIKKLDDAQMDLLVGEMHSNDEKGKSVNCETRMKLCQAVCSCTTNGTDSDLTKYEIIKGFLGWLKDLNMEKMAPISV